MQRRRRRATVFSTTSRFVAMGVVDRLEPIQIHEQHSQMRVLALCQCKRLLYAVTE